MARTLIPRSSNTQSMKIKPSHWEKYLGHIIGDYIRTGFTVTNGGGLNASVAAGSGWIEGIYIESDAPETVALTNNNTNHIFAQISRSPAGQPDTWAFVANVTGTPPADSVKVAQVVTSGGSISSINQLVVSGIFKQDNPVLQKALSLGVIAGDDGGLVTIYGRRNADNTFARIEARNSISSDGVRADISAQRVGANDNAGWLFRVTRVGNLENILFMRPSSVEILKPVDLDRISAPANPPANQGRIYVKQIDANNDGVFCKIKRDDVFHEVQII